MNATGQDQTASCTPTLLGHTGIHRMQNQTESNCMETAKSFCKSGDEPDILIIMMNMML